MKIPSPNGEIAPIIIPAARPAATATTAAPGGGRSGADPNELPRAEVRGGGPDRADADRGAGAGQAPAGADRRRAIDSFAPEDGRVVADPARKQAAAQGLPCPAGPGQSRLA